LRKGLEGVLQQAERISGIISRMANVKQYVTKPYIEGKNIVDFDFASQARESCP